MSQICETQNKILEAITQIHDIKRLITNIQDISQDQENLINTEPSNNQLQTPHFNIVGNIRKRGTSLFAYVPYFFLSVLIFDGSLPF